MKSLDIIFFIPMTKFNKMNIVDNGTRETDPVYISEIDQIFKGLQAQYQQHPQENPFFPRDDSPALIEIFGSRKERIQMIKLYLDDDGDVIGGENGANEVFSPENISLVEDLLKEQQKLNDSEKAYTAEMDKIKDFVRHNKGVDVGVDIRKLSKDKYDLY
jgi:hypothetical protein